MRMEFRFQPHILVICSLLLSACATSPARANEETTPTWKWKGFEVFGNHRVAKGDIQALIPIHEGDPYQEHADLWKQWCTEIKDKFRYASTNCSSLRYANFEAYFIIDVVEPGSEYRDQFRAIPQKTIPLANPKILTVYEKLYQRMWELFNKGTPPKEAADQGYLDFSDPEMHGYVQQLVQTVPAFRENLLEVLANDQDLNKREKAANLLNWSVENLAGSIVRSNQLLDDPSSLVRNNISRFTLHFTDKLQSPMERRQVIDNLLIQLNRPSFADRNKSIYNLVMIAQKFKSDRPYIRTKGKSLIQYISEASVLPNVKDPATELLQLIQKPK
jgi:hypothetical protein